MCVYMYIHTSIHTYTRCTRTVSGTDGYKKAATFHMRSVLYLLEGGCQRKVFTKKSIGIYVYIYTYIQDTEGLSFLNVNIYIFTYIYTYMYKIHLYTRQRETLIYKTQLHASFIEFFFP